MAKAPTDAKLNMIKFARVLVYLVYAYLIIAVSFLITGFILLLLGASQSSSFVDFVYRIAAEFLAPFRGMFPPHQITDSSYFSAAGLFAIIMYGIFAIAIHSFIGYITLKQTKHQNDLLIAQADAKRVQEKLVAQKAIGASQRSTRSTVR